MSKSVCVSTREYACICSSTATTRIFYTLHLFLLMFLVLLSCSFSSTATALFLDEVDITSSPGNSIVLQSIPIPTPSSLSGAVGGCTTDASTSTVTLSLSGDRTAVLFSCYAAPVGTANPASIPYYSTPYARVVARVFANGSVDTNTWAHWTPFGTVFSQSIGPATVANGSSGTQPLYIAGQDDNYDGRLRIGTLDSPGTSDSLATSVTGVFTRL